MGTVLRKYNEIKKFKRFGSRGQFDEWLNSNANLEQKNFEAICDDYEHRVYWVSENLAGGFTATGKYLVTIVTWSCFVFEKEDIEMYASEAKFESEENHKLLYDQQYYDD